MNFFEGGGTHYRWIGQAVSMRKKSGHLSLGKYSYVEVCLNGQKIYQVRKMKRWKERTKTHKRGSEWCVKEVKGGLE